MKLAAYHHDLGDEVRFVRGCDASASSDYWDRIYITSLFTYDWDKVVSTVGYYRDNLFGSSVGRIFVGGIAATLLPHQLYGKTGVFPITGPLMSSAQLGDPLDVCIDELVPDYSILEQVPHQYRYGASFLARTTRGCIRRCAFCAVRTIEPKTCDYIDIKPIVTGIQNQIGDQAELILLDNNVLASHRLADIVDDIVEMGFSRGAKLDGRQRTVDFNQGIDARLVDVNAAKQLARLPLKPIRIAYDRASDREVFERATLLLAEQGFKSMSNYMLYNFEDQPTELWERLHHCVEFGEATGVKIWSFPMRFVPMEDTRRGHVGIHWNRRLLRGMQCVSLVTRGAISHRHDFFHKAFGRSPGEFLEILSMPDRYIIHRSKHENNGAAEWHDLFGSLDERQLQHLWQSTSDNTKLGLRSSLAAESEPTLRQLLTHYVES